MDPVMVRDTLHNIWEPAVILNRPNPEREPRTYLVEMRGKVFQRTQEHIKPRSPTMAVTPPVGDAEVLLPPVVPDEPQPVPASPMKKMPVQTTRKTNPQPEKTTEGPRSFQPRSQTTRAGRVTQVPSKFRD
jgi:hypothetical protein